MQIRVFQFGAGGKRGGLAIGALAIALGGLFLVFGLLLLAALATVGVVAGAGALLLRALRGGRRPAELEPPDGWRARLDPSLEVRPAPAERLPGGGGRESRE